MRSIIARLRRSAAPDPVNPEPRSALYEQARRLGIEGRSKMNRRQLEAAVASAQRRRRSSRSLARFRLALLSALALLPRRGAFRWSSVRGAASFATLVSLLRTPGPLRAVILSVAAVATGVLGLVVAYAVVPQEGVAAQGNGSTLRLVTVTGPGGTTTLAVTRTKQGKTRLVPVHVLRTVTGPGGVRTLSIAVTGPTVTDKDVITQIHQHTETQVVQSTQTEVVTETQPVTVVVTQPETVVVTETVTVVETTTVVVPPGP